jgi:hypothetical protein
MFAILLTAACLLAQDAPKAEAKPTPARPKAVTRRVPVPGYSPRVGHTAHLWAGPGTGVALADGITAYEDLFRFDRAGDRAGIDGLLKSGVVVSADPGTPVKLVERKDYVKPIAFEVRVLEGPYKDKLFWASASDLAQLREATARRGGKMGRRKR